MSRAHIFIVVLSQFPWLDSLAWRFVDQTNTHVPCPERSDMEFTISLSRAEFSVCFRLHRCFRVNKFPTLRNILAGSNENVKLAKTENVLWMQDRSVLFIGRWFTRWEYLIAYALMIELRRWKGGLGQVVGVTRSRVWMNLQIAHILV